MDITPDTTLDESTKSREFFEPWHPEVGQRVRVRLSGECRAPLEPLSGGLRVGATYRHPQEFDGLSGTVIETRDKFYENSGHQYHVQLDTHVWVNGEPFWLDHFAAIELEPIDE